MVIWALDATSRLAPSIAHGQGPRRLGRYDRRSFQATPGKARIYGRLIAWALIITAARFLSRIGEVAGVRDARRREEEVLQPADLPGLSCF